MDKPRLFLNSTDIAQMTGQGLRNARNIMRWIRTERQLSNNQVISVIDFCVCFPFPVDLVFLYINSKDFKVPLTEFELQQRQKEQQNPSKSPTRYIDLAQFEPFIHKERTKHLNKFKTKVEDNTDVE